MEELLNQVLDNQILRKQYFEHDFIAWALYYFPQDYGYLLSATHKKYMRSLSGLNDVFICGFREFGKTVIFKHYLLWCICYKKYRNIMIYTYEISNARNILLDVINKLQINESIIRDYGSLYNSNRSKNKSEKKTVTEFITNNEIRVKAMSIGKSPRGDIFGASDGQRRPDLIGFDDIDVTKSVQNERVIDYTYNRLLSEVFAGLSQDKAKKVFLGNVILEDGVVPRIYNQYPTWDRYRVPIIDDDGNLVWPERYTQQSIIKLQDKFGDVSFNQNFLLKPYSGQGIVKRGWIKYVQKKEKYDKIVIGADPAISTKQLSDGFGIVISGHYKDGKDILGAIKLKGEEKEKDNAIGVIVGLYHKYQANIVNFESTNAYDYLAQDLKAKNIAVNTINPHKDKVTRLLEYESQIKNGVIGFVLDGEGIGELINELLMFPNGKNDDLVDAMIYSLTDKYSNIGFDLSLFAKRL